jgi:hypothetical protein
MKEITYKILDRLKNLPHIPGSQFSQTSRGFLTKIFHLFIEGQKSFSSVKINSENSANCKDNVDDYVPNEIKDSINKKRKHKTELTFHVHDRKIVLSMYHFENISSALLNQHINRVYLWLYVGSHFAPSKCSRTLNINIYFTDAKKGLPLSKQPLQSIHANTAFTTSCSIETEINIFRQEEWFKVLIHETFHCLGLDFSESRNERSNAQILKIFPVKSDVRLFETYCETWAETINVMFIAFSSTRHNNIAKMLEKTEKMMHYERMFSLLQCTKVLKHFHLTYDELYKKDALSDSKRKENYKEETQILSYYILKCIYMFHLNEYIEWCLSNNGETLNFHKTPENIEKYSGLLESLYNRPEFLSAIGKYENVVPSTLTKTLRMSVFELV